MSYSHSTFQDYFDDVLSRERRKPHRNRQVMSFDIEKNEYLCPLCESLCNTALPLMPPQRPAISPRGVSVHVWLKGLLATLGEKVTVTISDYDQVNQGGPFRLSKCEGGGLWIKGWGFVCLVPQTIR